MINTFRTTTRPGRRMLRPVVFLALAGAHAAGCAYRVVEPDPPVTEGEAILAALEYMAEGKWGLSGTMVVRGQAAVRYRGTEPLPDSTRAFLDDALEARGWRWFTEDPRVPPGCVIASVNCRLKNPTELYLTFSVWRWPGAEDHGEEPTGPLSRDNFHVEPVPGEEGYKVHVEWLMQRDQGGPYTDLGGEGVVVTRGTDGLAVQSVMVWII
ncbi:MAG: hypothetical protein OXU69_01120 [Gemmatimonadota bacterium]|nr:hypothetical protein [Gemmatimonadota bacterium]MDE2983276.1 hypothetical protein [Gemmatimonadota bacterium]